jgi:hypothetical protein
VEIHGIFPVETDAAAAWSESLKQGRWESPTINKGCKENHPSRAELAGGLIDCPQLDSTAVGELDRVLSDVTISDMMASNG